MVHGLNGSGYRMVENTLTTELSMLTEAAVALAAKVAPTAVGMPLATSQATQKPTVKRVEEGLFIGLFAIDGVSQQDVARLTGTFSVAGIDVNDAVDDRGAAMVK